MWIKNNNNNFVHFFIDGKMELLYFNIIFQTHYYIKIEIMYNIYKNKKTMRNKKDKSEKWNTCWDGEEISLFQFWHYTWRSTISLYSVDFVTWRKKCYWKISYS